MRMATCGRATLVFQPCHWLMEWGTHMLTCTTALNMAPCLPAPPLARGVGSTGVEAEDPREATFTPMGGKWKSQVSREGALLVTSPRRRQRPPRSTSGLSAEASPPPVETPLLSCMMQGPETRATDIVDDAGETSHWSPSLPLLVAKYPVSCLVCGPWREGPVCGRGSSYATGAPQFQVPGAMAQGVCLLLHS